MHERTERAIARMTFAFCCALPTALTLSLIVITWTSWWQNRMVAKIENRLSTELGLVVEIEAVDRSDPAITQLDQVTFYEPETHQEVARIRQILWRDDGDTQSLVLMQPELQSTRLASAWKTLHDRLLLSRDRFDGQVRVSASDLTLNSATSPITFHDVNAWVGQVEQTQSIEAVVQCYPADSPPHDPSHLIEIAVRRDREADQPVTTWRMSTGSTALPCATFAQYAPWIEPLGHDAMFRGNLSWTLHPQGWTVDLGGSQISNIVLGQWLERLPHRITGKGTIQLERCWIVSRNHRPHVVDIAGSLRAKDGVVGPTFLRAAVDSLEFTDVPDVEHVIAYDCLALGFNINGPLMQLTGACRTEPGYEGLPSGVVLWAGGQIFASAHGETIPAIRLHRALAPAHSELVPIAGQTIYLGDFLMPPSRPLSTSTLPAPRIRTAENWSGGQPIAQPK